MLRWTLRSLVGFATLVTATSAHPACAQSMLPTDGSPGWIVETDYLYWALRTPGAEYGVTDIGGVQDRGPVGEVLSLSGGRESGVRIAFGRRFGGERNSGPEVLFRYTDLDFDMAETRVGPLRATFMSSDNSENDDSDNINTLGVETVTPDDRATSATARQTFDYQTYDLEIGQGLLLTESLAVRVSAGARAATVDSRFDVTYTGGDFQTAFSPFQQTDYSGGGLLLGGDLRWQLTRALRLDVGGDLGMMLGRVDTQTFIPDDEPGVPTNVTASETRMTPMLEMDVALHYQRPIGPCLARVAIGYEFVNWFNLSDTRTFSDSRIEAQNSHLVQDISLDGFFARLGVDF